MILSTQKSIPLLITLLLICSSLSIVTGAQHQIKPETISLTYTIPQPTISTITIQDIHYDAIKSEQLTIVGNPGEPAIPAKLCNILLPPNTDIDHISIQTATPTLLATNLYIQPVETSQPIHESKTPVITQPTQEIYQKNTLFPNKQFTTVGNYLFRGYTITVLQLHPLQYNPVTGDLYYYSDMTIQITTKNAQIDHSTYRGYLQDQHTLHKKIDNPALISRYDQLPTQPQSRDTYDMMILTKDAFVSGFEPLKQAHDAVGQATIIQTLSDVGSTDLNDIRDFIRQAYTTYGIEYVLIGGDTDHFPTPELWVYGLDEGTTPYETYLPSDIFYACLDGPYNYDGDGKWGEPTDGTNGNDVDLYAEVYVGRACVGNTQEINNFVTKTIAYLNKDPQDPYLAEMCLAGEYLGSYGIASYGGNYLDQMIDGSSDDGYTTVGIPTADYNLNLLYDRDFSGNYWPKSEIISIINSGIHTINHLGHASYGYNLKMYDSDIYSLNNDKYCFIYSQGCMAGGFDQGDCMAEYFTVKTDAGAFAVIMNARYGWFWSYSTDGDSQRFHRQFWDAVFDEDMPFIGQANHDSKEDNIGIIGRSCIRWVFYETNLFGDPMLSFLELETNNPPETPGAPVEKTGEPNTYQASTTDPENNSIEYMWDWGDGTYSTWLGPYSSGAMIETEHFYTKMGTYEIRVKARDETLKESAWSPPLVKTIETPVVQIMDVQGGFRTVQINIHNTIDLPLENVSWMMRFQGGFLLNGMVTNQNIEMLPALGSHTLVSRPVFGLGPSTLTVRLAYAEESYPCLIIGPFILISN